MPINHEEMIEEIEGHIRKFGGGFGEWCVGTAKDSRGPFFRRHLAADLGDGLAYRQAYTTSAAQNVVAHLVNARGLELDRAAVPDPGKIVFVYRKSRDSGLGVRDSGLETRDSGLGNRDTGHGIRDTADGARETGLGVGDSGKAGAAPPALPSDHPVFPRRAA